ncbi:hypothetical protein LTS10_006201 [Elasticomyces elasticus]|nr:hypothetical protein LTS10_006201 [Elasticomyces elasticus]
MIFVVSLQGSKKYINADVNLRPFRGVRNGPAAMGAEPLLAMAAVLEIIVCGSQPMNKIESRLSAKYCSKSESYRLPCLFVVTMHRFQLTSRVDTDNNTVRTAVIEQSTKWRGSVKRGNWSPDEDDKIVEMLSAGHSASEIAEQLDGRTSTGVYNRMYRTLGPAHRIEVKEMAPRFTTEEDNMLKSLRAQMLSWEAIMHHFPGRTRHMLKARLMVLNKAISNRFTSQDDEQLRYLREVECLTWSAIAQRMPNWTASRLCIRYCRMTPPSARVNILPQHMFTNTALLDDVRRMRDDGCSFPKIASTLAKEGFTAKRVHDLYASATTGTMRERYEDGTVSTRRLTKEESARIYDMRANKISWAEVAKSLGRSITMLRTHHRMLQDRVQSAPGYHNGDVKIKNFKAPKSFTHAETLKLIEKRAAGLSWKEIGSLFPGRSVGTLYNHYSKQQELLSYAGNSKKDTES